MGGEKSEEMVVVSSGGGGFYYSEMNSNSNSNSNAQFVNPISGGFGFETESTGDEFHQNMMVVGPWGQPPTAAAHDNRFHLLDDGENDSSSLRCVFPCEGNERPSQGLSLSLSSSNPSSIGLQSFELRPQQQQQQPSMFQLRNSRFLGPIQELLCEFCSLGGIANNNNISSCSPKYKGNNNNNRSIKQWESELDQDGSSSNKLPLHSLDFIELQKRKSKLLSMLEEVERRYRHYCEQMKAVVAAFEAVAGVGAARVYSALASKAMSRHFRCLKDGILAQIHATKRAMGETKEAAAVAAAVPGTTRGETPRLRVIDQALRQHRAFHQISLMESHPWRPQRGLPERSVSVLRAWLFEHFLHPYPSDVDKHILARQTGLSRSQVSNWFINARVRLWKPMVEEMYLEEIKEQEDQEINYNNNFSNSNNNNANNSSDGVADFDDDDIDGHHHRPMIPTRPEDQKPTPDQLLRIDSEYLSSIISDKINVSKTTTKSLQNHHQHAQSHSFGRVPTNAFGTVELDFSAYNHHSGSGGVTYPNNNNNQHFNNGSGSGGGGVSLTLGLQQHVAGGGNGSGGVSIAFSSAAVAQSSLFFPREQMEECQPVQYSLLDGEAQNNLPYRNLMGTQLLHDLAG